MNEVKVVLVTCAIVLLALPLKIIKNKLRDILPVVSVCVCIRVFACASSLTTSEYLHQFLWESVSISWHVNLSQIAEENINIASNFVPIFMKLCMSIPPHEFLSRRN
jgi:hypothetical protein